jgi:protein disulfide-isomerase A6
MNSNLRLILILCFSTLYTVLSASASVKLTASNFNKEVVNSPDIYLVEFFAPWCGRKINNNLRLSETCS